MEAAWRHTDTLIFQSRYQEILLLVQDDPLEDLMRVSGAPCTDTGCVSMGGRNMLLLRSLVRRLATHVGARFREEHLFLSYLGGRKCPVIAYGSLVLQSWRGIQMVGPRPGKSTLGWASFLGMILLQLLAPFGS